MIQERYQEAAEWLKGDALGWCKNSHLHAIDTPQHKESVGIAEKVELAASVLSKLASGFVLVPGEPTEAMLACIAFYKWPEDWNAGKDLQKKQLAENRVPPKTEYECAVGQYYRLLAAAPRP